MTLPAAAVFSSRGSDSGERFAGAGLTQRALHVPGRQPDR